MRDYGPLIAKFLAQTVPPPPHEDGFRGCEPCRLKKAQAARLAKQEAELRKGPPLPLSPGRKA